MTELETRMLEADLRVHFARERAEELAAIERSDERQARERQLIELIRTYGTRRAQRRATGRTMLVAAAILWIICWTVPALRLIRQVEPTRDHWTDEHGSQGSVAQNERGSCNPPTESRELERSVETRASATMQADAGSEVKADDGEDDRLRAWDVPLINPVLDRPFRGLGGAELQASAFGRVGDCLQRRVDEFSPYDADEAHSTSRFDRSKLDLRLNATHRAHSIFEKRIDCGEKPHG